MYHLNISSKYAKQYQSEIGSVLHADKLDNLVKFIERNDIKFLSEQIDKINGLGEIIAHCGKTLQLPGQSRTYGFWKNKDTIGRRTLEKYYNIFNEHPDKKLIKDELFLIEQAINSDVIWDEIVDIEIIPGDPKLSEDGSMPRVPAPSHPKSSEVRDDAGAPEGCTG